MAKATIKSKTGAVITVEGTEEEVSRIINGYERSATTEQVRHVISKTQTVKKEQKKRMAASDLIVGLKEDGYFNKPRPLTDIAAALEEKGYIYPVTTLSGVVIGLVQKKMLGRKKSEGKWVYGK